MGRAVDSLDQTLYDETMTSPVNASSEGVRELS
jgi:hypothetical protein